MSFYSMKAQGNYSLYIIKFIELNHAKKMIQKIHNP